MKPQIYKRIMKVVRQRERSYEMMKDTTGWGKAQKLKAIANIKHKMSFYSEKSAEVHARVVCSLKEQLLAIAPSERSRFQGVRKEIISLLNECEELKEQLV